MKSINMRRPYEKEYDFSRAERGKFSRPGAVLIPPVYLDQEALRYVKDIAERNDKDISAVMNEIIKSAKKIVLSEQ